VRPASSPSGMRERRLAWTLFDLHARDGFLREIRAAENNASRILCSDQAGERVVARGGSDAIWRLGWRMSRDNAPGARFYNWFTRDEGV